MHLLGALFSIGLLCLHAMGVQGMPSPGPGCPTKPLDLSQLDASMDAVDALSVLQQAAKMNLQERHEQGSNPPTTRCSLNNAAVRKDWYENPGAAGQQ